MQAVVLSFDSLAARSIGCYGNEWIETPNFDRLAATGVVFDLHFADAIDDNAGLSWATTQLSTDQALANDHQSIGDALRHAGVQARLISATSSQPWQVRAQFEQAQLVEGQSGPDADPSSVPIAELVKAGLAAWNDPSFQSQQRLLWLHAPAPGIPPKGFDSLYFEDFEERGQIVEQLSDEERRQHPAMYGGSVSLIDHWLGELITGLNLEQQSTPTLLIVTALRGQLWQPIPSANPQASTTTNQTLTDQVIQTPLILKLANDERFTIFQSQRSDRLTQSSSLAPTLVEWLRHPEDSASVNSGYLGNLMSTTAGRTQIRVANGDRGFAIRTPEWLCIHQSNRDQGSESAGHAMTSRLYTKPEDVWDMNDVAAQNSEIVSKLLEPLG